MRGDAELGDLVHLAGPDLRLDALTLGADDAGMERAVVVGLGRRDVVLEAARHLAEQGALKIIGGQTREAPGFRANTVVASSKAWAAGLKSFKDLPGHSVAITQIGSSFHYDLALLSEKYGFDLKTVRMPMRSASGA